ncbi:hypothetical protein ACC807_15355 [Rhizobium ruizarguesonis]|uniref:hypothetical protein n=1 Tax=Rhizobium ruizarguesonis TaxID=2081791 RepID=UPI00103C0CE3|nr:hypothetical protein [Rhizobium ruizarguesonis]NEH38173.1 hypothetical protein [Rhizobium ruizarguesonis]TBY85475.1 hypothetical protein E0H40_27310 [Rhizobium leguminosarum bv. viciae]
MNLEAAIAKRYPIASEAGAMIRERVLRICEDHIRSALADANCEQRLCSDDHSIFWQQFSEVLIAYQLQASGLKLSHAAQGPDILIEHGGQRVWIEVITPEPRGLPDAWINHTVGNVVSLPHEQLLLRWTAAIKEKAEKLLGRTDSRTGKPIPGYRDKAIVREEDTYVIAINGRLLRGFGAAFPELTGISQFPYAVESTLAVGPLQIRIDRTTLAKLGSGHQHRTRIRKPSGAEVPADTFLNSSFSPISAIWAVDVDEILLLGEARPMVVAHNPLASMPLLPKFLPAQSEYFADVHPDYYEIRREDGVLAK